MAQVRGLSRGITQVGSLPSPSGTKRRRLALSFAVAGALSFWLPDVVVHIVAGPNFDSRHVWVCTILMPATFLLAYVVARRFGMKRDFKWVGPAMLLGVWLTGGLFMTIAAMASGTQTSEWGRIRTETQARVYPIASTLQQRSVVRRTQEDELAQMLRPDVACHHAVVVCATRHQASHAVGEDRELFQGFWPFPK